MGDNRGVMPLCMRGNMAENWKLWRARFENYLVASEVCKKDEKTQCAQLLHYIGDDGFKIYTTFKLEEGQQNKLRDLLQKQEEGKSLEDFIIELKKKASRCKLEGLQDSLIVTMITCGIRNEAIRQRLLEDDTLTLEKAVELCQVIESAKVRSQAMGQGNIRKVEIDMVHKKTGHNSTKNIIKNGAQEDGT
ncbi:hypothetical protein QE152_g19491 [Popillia japonica]|uniref:Retrotransposon gag domain-containing protein n=1 Tax=Popillia japonica TaxID=7064 RepID=A0AAW1KR60_POPJA